MRSRGRGAELRQRLGRWPPGRPTLSRRRRAPMREGGERRRAGNKVPNFYWLCAVLANLERFPRVGTAPTEMRCRLCGRVDVYAGVGGDSPPQARGRVARPHVAVAGSGSWPVMRAPRLQTWPLRHRHNRDEATNDLSPHANADARGHHAAGEPSRWALLGHLRIATWSSRLADDLLVNGAMDGRPGRRPVLGLSWTARCYRLCGPHYSGQPRCCWPEERATAVVPA